MIQFLKLLEGGVFPILRISTLTLNISKDTIETFFHCLGIFIGLFLGLFVAIFLTFSLIFLIYNILYFLISKIDWIKNKKIKEFVLIEKKKFILYIMKFSLIIIFMSFFSFFIKDLMPVELINFGYYIFNNLHMTLYWLSSMLLYYTIIYFFIINKISDIKNYVLLFTYRFIVFFILRIILYIICPEQYTMYLSQGLISILLFPDLILNILNKISDFLGFLTIWLCPLTSVAEAEGMKFTDYLDEKYPEGDPKRDKANYPRLTYWKDMPALDRITNFTVEDLFYRPPPNENIFLEEYTFLSGRTARQPHRVYSIELREVWFMCSGGDEPYVSMPVFIKYYGIHTHPLPENYITVEYEDGRSDIFIYRGERSVINYIITDNVYTLKSSGNRENYSPSYLLHLYKKIHVQKQGYLIGNSRGRILENKNIVNILHEEFLREKYNIKHMTD